MKSFANTANPAMRRPSASLRHAVEFMCRALATYTPTGPGSLATGQSGAFRRDGTLPDACVGGLSLRDSRIRPARIEASCH